MALYCGTLDVVIKSQVVYDQFQPTFASSAAYASWITGTLIPEAMDIVDKYVGHNFLANDGTLLLDGSGKTVQHINRAGLVNGAVPELLPLPLIAVTAINIDSVAVTPVTDVKVYRSWLAYEFNQFDWGRQNVEVVCTWGYVTVPEDIRHVTAQLCSNVLTEMLRLRRIPDLITPILEGGGNIGILFRSPKVLTKNETIILKRHRILEMVVA